MTQPLPQSPPSSNIDGENKPVVSLRLKIPSHGESSRRNFAGEALDNNKRTAQIESQCLFDVYGMCLTLTFGMCH